MAMQEVRDEVRIYEAYTNGILDPGAEMLGPIESGSRVVVRTAPGCWGPMITPAIRGGHEVTTPLAVIGAEPGDAVAISITAVTIESLASASGNDQWMEGRFLGDPYIAGKCPGCGTLYPKTHLSGVGQDAVRCDECGADATPFTFTNGYTMAFDEEHSIGVTLDERGATEIGRSAAEYAALPKSSAQNPILAFAPHDLVGIATRLQPFLGQFGTTPAIALPDSHNAGDFGSFLVGAAHEYAITAEELEHRTDGHMDIDAVREGAILVCPVKVPGAGVYLGDMHALQGDGEIAGHTCDVTGTVEFEVEVIKDLPIDGPLLFPLSDDLPRLARPLTTEERETALDVARRWNISRLEDVAPISVIGTGPDLNSATDNGLARAADLFEMTIPEVKNRATITGAIEIGRHPGVVQVTFLVPTDRLEAKGLLNYAQRQYDIAQG
jgi:acetamidase/formamidase